MDALVNVRHRPPERVTEQHHTPHPAESSADSVEKVAPVAHLCGACYRRAKCPDDRNKSRQDDRLAAISLIKFVCALKVPSLEKSRVPTIVQAGTGLPANQIADLISRDRAQRHERKQPG